MILARSSRYAFEADEGDGFRRIGGENNKEEMARLCHRDYLDRRDKRRKMPKMRLVEICTTETVMEELRISLSSPAPLPSATMPIKGSGASTARRPSP